jgi:hypothetical protein
MEINRETTITPAFLNLAFDMYQAMKDNGISLMYEGEVSQSITKAFTAMAESSMKKSEEDESVQQRVYHVMVECLQNISKHADPITLEEEDTSGNGMFLVQRGEEKYSITTGNAVTNEKAKELKINLDKINSLDKSGLKKLYKELLTNGRFSDKAGAGLGFVDIAKKTDQKFDYHFLPMNEKFSFFILKITVPRNL